MREIGESGYIMANTTIKNNGTIEGTVTVSTKKLNKKADKKATKKLLNVNTKGVKIDPYKSVPEFREIVGKYYMAEFEMADTVKIYKNNVEILENSVSELNGKVERGETLSDSDRLRLNNDSAMLVDYTKKYEAYRAEYAERTKKCYEIITDALYNAYVDYITLQKKVVFRNAMRTWLGKYNIEVTDSLVDFLCSVVGMNVASAGKKASSKGKVMLTGFTRSRFDKTFMHALCQLLVDKNCIKPENYTFTYTEKSETFIPFETLDNMELKVEVEEKANA